MGYYVFRVNNGDEFIQTEINNGRLRQGWGTKNLALQDKFGNAVSLEKWKEGYEWKDTDDAMERGEKVRERILNYLYKNNIIS